MEKIDYDKIHDYFSQQLSEAEQANFEQEIATNKDLAEEVAFYQALMGGVDMVGDQALENAIKTSHEQADANGLLLTDQDIFDYFQDNSEKNDQIEQRVSSDEVFQTEFDFDRNLMEGIDLLGDRNLQDSIKAVHKKMKQTGALDTEKEAKVVQLNPKTTRRRLFNTRNIAIAASLLLLITIGLYFLIPSTGPNPDLLYANNFNIDEDRLESELEQLSLTGFAAAEKVRKESLTLALEQFQNQEYQAASTALATHISNYPEDETAQFYYGLTAMQNNNFEAALERLQPLADSSTSTYQTAAQWYQALSYLKLGDTNEAIDLIEQLESTTQYGEQAARLLESLGR